MDPRQVKTVEDAKAIIEERGLSHIKVGIFDIDGILRGKYMSKAKFISSLEKGFGMCDVVLGWDCQDKTYDNIKITGDHTGYPDAMVRILPDTCREIIDEDGMLIFLAEFIGPHGAVCPRGTLRRVLDKAADMGFNVFAGMEFEFFLFDETPESVREKNYQNLTPLQPGWFGYSALKISVESELYQDFLDFGEQMDIPIEGLHEETGPGVMEAALAVDDALRAADKAALFKTFAKVVAQKRGIMATFMAKWSLDYPGQSGHIHMSLQRKTDGSGAFYDSTKPGNISDNLRHFIGGQQKLMPETLAMSAPTINSYTRLIPGFWAPTDASWGMDNRTCSLRGISGSEKSQRVEYRVAAADVNPYLALAASIGTGLWGIENKIEPGKGVVGTSYDIDFPKELQLPRNLMEAAHKLKNSQPARDIFGDEFVDHYAATREWEQREFDKYITDWELKRYFEII